jgi:hypothetical protein
MVELASYGLTGLTAVVLVAFCLACSIELPSIREESSHDLLNKAHINDSSMIEARARSPRFRSARQVSRARFVGDNIRPQLGNKGRLAKLYS